MSTFEKLIQRIKKLDKGLRFNEVKKVLLSYGYDFHFPHSGSSHATFRKTGCDSITIPVHEPIKRIYILLVKEAIERIDDDDNEEKS
ncbi:MAG: toxin HicA [Selenomonadaceae bacterium]|nr:toxin HicA [Selenomonadaceae bacterium]